MMGASHALSGAAAWLGGSLVAEHLLRYHQSPAQITVGALVCAGSALIPDLDMAGGVIHNRGGATFSRTYGRAGLVVAEGANRLSKAVYAATATAKDRRDQRCDGGHRFLWHTWPVNAAIGVLAWLLTATLGRWVVATILFVTVAPALRVLAPRKVRREFLAPLLLAAFLAGVAVFALPGGRGYPLLGLAVGGGCLVHLAGDAVTRQGIPLRWPFVFRGKRWWMSRLWLPLAIRAGGPGERFGYRPTFVGSTVVAVVFLADPKALSAVTTWLAHLL